MKILNVDMIKYSIIGLDQFHVKCSIDYYNICYTKSVQKLVDFLKICSYIGWGDKYIEKCLSDMYCYLLIQSDNIE